MPNFDLGSTLVVFNEKRKGKTKMKIYDVIYHKSFEIDPNNINLAATKKSQGYMVWLHESSDKWNTPYACGVLCTNKKTWKKIVSISRSKLN